MANLVFDRKIAKEGPSQNEYRDSPRLVSESDASDRYESERCSIGALELAWRSFKPISVLLAPFAILLILVVFILTAVPSLLGFSTMMVVSGSMEPAIHVGDAVLIKKVNLESITIGDEITFLSPEGHTMTTHRVIAVMEIQGGLYYQTKGDFNATPDPNLVAASNVYGKVALTLPKAGYLLHAIATTWGKVVFIWLPIMVLTAQELREVLRFKSIFRSKSKGKNVEGVPASEKGGSG